MPQHPDGLNQNQRPLVGTHRQFYFPQIFACFHLPRYLLREKKSPLERQLQRVRCNLLFDLPVNIIIFCVLYQFCFNYVCDADLERKIPTSAQKVLFPISQLLCQFLLSASPCYDSTLTSSYFSS